MHRTCILSRVPDLKERRLSAYAGHCAILKFQPTLNRGGRVTELTPRRRSIVFIGPRRFAGIGKLYDSVPQYAGTAYRSVHESGIHIYMPDGLTDNCIFIHPSFGVSFHPHFARARRTWLPKIQKWHRRLPNCTPTLPRSARERSISNGKTHSPSLNIPFSQRTVGLATMSVPINRRRPP